MENTVFQAELLAIDKAIDYTMEKQLIPINIISDSLSGLYGIKNLNQTNPIIREIQKKLGNNEGIEIQWTRAHVGTHGNELADDAAKGGAMDTDLQATVIKYPPSHLNGLINRNIDIIWQREWEEGRVTFGYFPRVDRKRLICEPNLVSLLTEHSFTPSYMARFGIEDCSNGICKCGAEGTAKHYVIECRYTKKYHLKAHATNMSDKWAESIIQSSYSKVRIGEALRIARNMVIESRDRDLD